MNNHLLLDLALEEKTASVQAVARKRGIDERAVEKDWWVTAILKALSGTECSRWLNFKGGTSLSKGWSLINRFSEDIDLSIGRGFFAEKLGLSCAKAENNTQLKNLRKASRDYIHGTLSTLLKKELDRMGISGYAVSNLTHQPTPEGERLISHDSDPTVIFVEYDSIFPKYNGDIQPKVKVEISCLSMDEPFEIKHIGTMINEEFNDVDIDLGSEIRTVTPARTFLEKALLLNEEFQKDNPRHRRMSRHLYDLERIMDTEYGHAAISDISLYRVIVEHRKKFYHLGYVDYFKDYPKHIDFVPTGKLLNAFKRDYYENMVDGYIYRDAMPFDALIERMKELQARFRDIPIE